MRCFFGYLDLNCYWAGLLEQLLFNKFRSTLQTDYRSLHMQGPYIRRDPCTYNKHANTRLVQEIPKKWAPTQSDPAHVNPCFFVEMDVSGKGGPIKNYSGKKIFCSSINFGLKPSLGFTHGYKVGTSIRNVDLIGQYSPVHKGTSLFHHCPTGGGVSIGHFLYQCVSYTSSYSKYGNKHGRII